MKRTNTWKTVTAAAAMVALGFLGAGSATADISFGGGGGSGQDGNYGGFSGTVPAPVGTFEPSFAPLAPVAPADPAPAPAS